MAAPIDKLIISVEIEEGSKIEELYQMLKDLQQAGGKIEVETGIEGFATENQVRETNRRITTLVNTFKSLIEKFPSMIDPVRELLQDNCEILEKFVENFGEWKGEIESTINDVYDLVNTITTLIKDINENISQESTAKEYNKILTKLNELIKKVRIIFEQQFVDELNRKLDDIRSQVNINLLQEIKDKTDRIIDVKVPEIKGWFTTKAKILLNRFKDLVEDWLENNISFDELKVSIQDAKSSMISEIQNIFVKDITKLQSDLQTVKEELIDKIESIHIPSYISAYINYDRIREVIEEIQLPGEDIDIAVQTLTNIIEEKYENTFEILQSIKTRTGNVASRTDMLALKESFEKMRGKVKKQFKEFLNDYYDTTLTWKNFSKRLDLLTPWINTRAEGVKGHVDLALQEFKGKLDDNLRGVLGEEYADLNSIFTALVDLEDLRQTVNKLWELFPDVPSLIESEFSQISSTLTVIANNLEMFLAADIDNEIDKLKTPYNNIVEILWEHAAAWNKIMTLQLEETVIVRDIRKKLIRKLIEERDEFNKLNENINRLREIKLPKPEIPTPKIELPKPEIPEIKIPTPIIELPKIEIPAIELPKIELPELPEIPEIPAPIIELELPKIELPEISTPIIEIEDLKMEMLDSFEKIKNNIQSLSDYIFLFSRGAPMKILREFPERGELGPAFEDIKTILRILGKEEVKEAAMEKIRPAVVGVRGANIQQIRKFMSVLNIQNISEQSQVEDILKALEEQVIRPFYELDTALRQNFMKNLERNNMELESLTSVLKTISNQIRYVEDWNKDITNKYLLPTKTTVEDISAKLEPKSPMDIADKNDPGKKGGFDK